MRMVTGMLAQFEKGKLPASPGVLPLSQHGRDGDYMMVCVLFWEAGRAVFPGLGTRQASILC